VRIVLHCSCLLLLAAASAWAQAEDALTAWGEEIEKTAGRIVFVRVELDPRNQVRIPKDTERADILLPYLRDETFRNELSAAHALTLNWEGNGEKYHFVLLNMALAAQWKDASDGLIAHEIGHIWLHAKGLAAPPYEAGPDACITIQTADMVQHALIREEMQRRGISGKEYLLNNLKLAMKGLGSGKPAQLDSCRRLIVLSHWLDFRFGIAPGDWGDAEHYAELHAARYPDIEAAGSVIEEYLRTHEISDRKTFLQAVDFVKQSSGI
jgi:hypothetical protein